MARVDATYRKAFTLLWEGVMKFCNSKREDVKLTVGCTLVFDPGDRSIKLNHPEKGRIWSRDEDIVFIITAICQNKDHGIDKEFIKQLASFIAYYAELSASDVRTDTNGHYVVEFLKRHQNN